MAKMDKKVLLISHNALSFCNNNGKTLASLFADWDKNCLAQVFFNREQPDSERFESFFRFGDLDVASALLMCRWRGGCGQPVMARKVDSVSGNYPPAAFSNLAGIVNKYADVKLISRDIVYFFGQFFLGRLYEWVARFRPDSVFFVGGNSVFSFKIARRIARHFRVPIDIYITDDYVINACRSGGVGGVLDKRLRNVYDEAFKEARHVFVIGEEMAENFSQVFGRLFVPVMNSVLIPKSLQRDDFGLRTLGKVDFVYAGGLHLGRDRSLIEFGRILKSVSDKLGLEVRLTVYSLQKPGSGLLEKLDEVGVVFGGGMGPSDIAKRMSEADFVLHVESFDPENVRLTKLSVSTKIPEYLASGACVVAFGPSELASIRLLQRNGLGVVLTEDDGEGAMLEKLTSVISSAGYRKQLAISGYSYAKAHFDADVVRGRIKVLLNQ